MNDTAIDRPKWRMVWWRELKWLAASYLLIWFINLIQKEASEETLLSLLKLSQSMKNDTKYDTIKVRDQH